MRIRATPESTYRSPDGDWSVTLATAEGRLLGYFVVAEDGFTERFVLADVLTRPGMLDFL